MTGEGEGERGERGVTVLRHLILEIVHHFGYLLFFSKKKVGRSSHTKGEEITGDHEHQEVSEMPPSPWHVSQSVSSPQRLLVPMIYIHPPSPDKPSCRNKPLSAP